MTLVDRLTAAALGSTGSRRSVMAPSRLFALHRTSEALDDLAERLMPWLLGLEAAIQITLLTDRLEGCDVRPLGLAPTRVSASDPDLDALGERLAGEGLVRRDLYLTIVGPAEETAIGGLADAGLTLVPLGEREAAALRRRLLMSAPLAPVLHGVNVSPLDRLATERHRVGPGETVAGPATPARGERTLGRLSLPDHLHIQPGHVEGDAGSAVLMYIDGLPRELEADALAMALRAPEPVDVSLRLWPLAGDDVIRHLTRRLRDLRATQAMGGETTGDFRLATAVEDAERLREALYLGRTRLLQVSVVLAARGPDRAAALTVAARLRARLGRSGFLPRLAVLRQWPALASMLPGAPDRLGAAHNLTSQAAAHLLPFALTVPRPTGTLVGRDEIDHAAVHLDRTALANPAAAYLGAPGSGKSSLAKMEILRRARAVPGDRFLIVDPEGEYARVVGAIADGLELDAARVGPVRLPLLPVLLPDAAPAMRAARAATLVTPLLGAAGDLGRGRVARALEAMLARGCMDLADLPTALEPLDSRLAEAATRALGGPLSILAGTVGPGPEVRALSLNLSGVDTATLPVLLPVLTEAAIGHLHPARGRSAGLLWLTLDELHLYLERETGARLLVELAKRARKRGIVLTAVTQHVVDLLRHPDGQAILAACEVVALFRPGVDLRPFAEVLRLDAEAALQAATLAPGQALLRVGARRHMVRVVLSDAEAAIADTRPQPLRSGRVDGPQANGGGTRHAGAR